MPELMIKRVRNIKTISLYIGEQALATFYQKFGFVENGEE
jgi:predicted GNAT family N-acyltransferase